MPYCFFLICNPSCEYWYVLRTLSTIRQSILAWPLSFLSSLIVLCKKLELYYQCNFFVRIVIRLKGICWYCSNCIFGIVLDLFSIIVYKLVTGETYLFPICWYCMLLIKFEAKIIYYSSWLILCEILLHCDSFLPIYYIFIWKTEPKIENYSNYNRKYWNFIFEIHGVRLSYTCQHKIAFFILKFKY